MTKLGVVVPLVEQAAFTFSGATGATFTGEDLRMGRAFQFLVFLRWREVFVVVGHEFCTDSRQGCGDESHAPRDDALAHADNFVGVELSCGLDGLVVDEHRFGATGRRGEGTGFKQPHIP